MKKYVSNKLFFKLIIVLSVVSALRNLFLPLAADELTYLKLSENLLKGRYFLMNHPSTVTPVVPFLFFLFKIKTYPLIGFAIHKLFHISLALLGGRFLFKYLKGIKINRSIIYTILALVSVNSNSVAWFSNLYPEAIIFCSFWGVMYYSHKKPSNKNLIKLLICFAILVFSRYVYAVLCVIIMYSYYEYLQSNFKKFLYPIIKYSIIFIIPFLVWTKYVHHIESENLSEISYFNRFDTENSFLYNIKCGLGLEKHYEVSKINGIPAFISLFIPKTGFRNYTLSVLLIFMFCLGFVFYKKAILKNKLFVSILLVMLGFMFAGTGFNRYWLALLPGFLLGFYYFFNRIGINNNVFIRCSQLICLLYFINELRLDILIINKL